MYGLLHVKMARPNDNRENSMLFGFFFLQIHTYKRIANES